MMRPGSTALRPLHRSWCTERQKKEPRYAALLVALVLLCWPLSSTPRPDASSFARGRDFEHACGLDPSVVAVATWCDDDGSASSQQASSPCINVLELGSDERNGRGAVLHTAVSGPRHPRDVLLFAPKQGPPVLAIEA